MSTKFLSLISIIGAASLCVVHAQSTTPESQPESHSTSKKAASHSGSASQASRKTAPGARTANAESRPSTGSSQGAAARTGEQASNPPAPGGGHGQVWVNTETGVYHREGSLFYGTTGKGKYMTEQDAIQAGYKPAGKRP